MHTAIAASETDSLLSKPGRTANHKDDVSNRPRYVRNILFGSAICCALVIGFSCERSGMYNPKKQLKKLDELTQQSIDSMQGISVPLLGRVREPKHKHGKIKVITDKDVNTEGVYHCTSTLMIMRHCDKGVKVKKHGHTRIIDPKDKNGDRHCNAKGKARSSYIASLFVEPDEYNKLVHHDLDRSKTSIPPVPMVSSNLKRNNSIGYTPAKKKPQFPTPYKLYALNDARDGHRNFREVETITPIANKFHLDVDDRFGVYDEEQLAKDYFEMLSMSVGSNVERMRRSIDAEDEKDTDGHSLCDDGLTIVNWKHSRIPSLARALGCGRDEGCPKKYYSKDFDTLWMVTFQYSMRLGSDGGLKSFEIEGSSRYGRSRKTRHGSWMISAQLVNEGFDPVSP